MFKPKRKSKKGKFGDPYRGQSFSWHEWYYLGARASINVYENTAYIAGTSTGRIYKVTF